MRRTAIVALSSVMVLATLTGPFARSLTVRTDPNDTGSRPDIRRVASARSSGLYFRITAWNRLLLREAQFYVLLDTRGSYEFDRIIECSYRDCVVEEIQPGGYLGAFIGRRSWARPAPKDVAIRVPPGWFDISKTVRFVVKSGFLGGRVGDRAPDVGRYIGV